MGSHFKDFQKLLPRLANCYVCYYNNAQVTQRGLVVQSNGRLHKTFLMMYSKGTVGPVILFRDKPPDLTYGSVYQF